MYLLLICCTGLWRRTFHFYSYYTSVRLASSRIFSDLVHCPKFTLTSSATPPNYPQSLSLTFQLANTTIRKVCTFYNGILDSYSKIQPLHKWKESVDTVIHHPVCFNFKQLWTWKTRSELHNKVEYTLVRVKIYSLGYCLSMYVFFASSNVFQYLYSTSRLLRRSLR